MAVNFFVKLVVFISCVLFCVRFTYSQCKEGEPKMNDPSENVPDLNITVSPASLVTTVGDVFNLTCIANKPRYEIQGVRTPFPHTIKAFLGPNVVRSCDVRREVERTQCFSTVVLDKTGNITATCRATSDSGCRTKMVTVKVLEKFIRVQASASSSMTSLSNMTQTSKGVQASALSSMTSLSNMAQTSTDVQASASSSMTSLSNMTQTSTGLQASPSSSMTLLSKQAQPSTASGTTTSTDIIGKGGIQASSSSSMTLASKLAPTSTASVATKSKDITGTEDGQEGKNDTSEDDDELDDVKKLITATLVLIIIMLLLMTVAIVYVLRQVGCK